MPSTVMGQAMDWTANTLNQRLAVEKLFNPTVQFEGDKPWLTRMAGWRDFVPTGNVAIPAVGSSATILSYLVPLGYDGVIDGVFFEYRASDFEVGDFAYRMFIDGRPVDNLENIQTNLGSSVIPYAIRVQLYSGNVVSLVVNHIANGTLNDKLVYGGIKGWLYPRSQV